MDHSAQRKNTWRWKHLLRDRVLLKQDRIFLDVLVIFKEIHLLKNPALVSDTCYIRSPSFERMVSFVFAKVTANVVFVFLLL